MNPQKITIPDIGCIDKARVVEICVAVGDKVNINDAIINIETDKVTIEIPTNYAGVVTALQIELNATVREGDCIATLNTESIPQAEVYLR